MCRTGPGREVNTSGAGDRYACIVEERVVATDGWQLLAAAAAALPLTAASSSIDPALSGYLLPLNHLWPAAAPPTCASCQVERGQGELGVTTTRRLATAGPARSRSGPSCTAFVGVRVSVCPCCVPSWPSAPSLRPTIDHAHTSCQNVPRDPAPPTLPPVGDRRRQAGGVWPSQGHLLQQRMLGRARSPRTPKGHRANN